MLSDISHTNKEKQACESIEADHEYELLDKYYTEAYEDIKVPQTPLPKQELQQSSSPGDYELTQCPTYVSVTHCNQQTQSSLTLQPSTTRSIEVMTGAGANTRM